jgi:hypothetical protein
MAGYGQNMMSIRNQASDLWTQMLKQAQGLQSGQTSPWNLPEFQQYQQQYQNYMDKFLKNIYAQGTARGLNPGAAMNQFGEQGIKGLNEAMMNLASQAYGRIPQYAQGGMNEWNNFANLWLKKQEQDLKEKEYNQANSMGWLKALVGAGAGLSLAEPWKLFGGGSNVNSGGGWGNGGMNFDPASMQKAWSDYGVN